MTAPARLPQTSSTGHGLGRTYRPDPRDTNYLLATALSPKVLQIHEGVRGTLTALGKQMVDASGSRRVQQSGVGIRKRPWVIGPTLNQGPRPHCVAYAWLQFLASAPIMQLPVGFQWTSTRVGRIIGIDETEAMHWTIPAYQWMQRNDEWAGEAYDGTSVRAGARYLQSLGMIAEYRWAWDVDTCIAWLRSAEGGPLVVGTDWFSGMDRLEQGYARPEGTWLGGHAYLVYWYSETRGAFRCKNSWGPRWGQGDDGGDFWLERDAFQYLLEALNGEACAARQTKLLAV